MDIPISAEQLEALRERARRQRSPRPPAAASPDATPFDPRQAGKLSPDQEEALRVLHESFAQSAAAALQGRLRVAVTMTFSELQRLTAEEVVSSCAPPPA